VLKRACGGKPRWLRISARKGIGANRQNERHLQCESFAVYSASTSFDRMLSFSRPEKQHVIFYHSHCHVPSYLPLVGFTRNYAACVRAAIASCALVQDLKPASLARSGLKRESRFAPAIGIVPSLRDKTTSQSAFHLFLSSCSAFSRHWGKLNLDLWNHIIKD
jgi:hypothetical protein